MSMGMFPEKSKQIKVERVSLNLISTIKKAGIQGQVTENEKASRHSYILHPIPLLPHSLGKGGCLYKFLIFNKRY